jgi:hypothetical protein
LFVVVEHELDFVVGLGEIASVLAIIAFGSAIVVAVFVEQHIVEVIVAASVESNVVCNCVWHAVERVAEQCMQCS